MPLKYAIQLPVIREIREEIHFKDDKGNVAVQSVLKSRTILHETFISHEIVKVEPCYDYDKHVIAKDRCVIFYKPTNDYYTIQKRKGEVDRLLFEKPKRTKVRFKKHK